MDNGERGPYTLAMALGKALETAAPFGALIPASSVVVAVLYVAGFAYRWSYYYNFGMQHIVYHFSFSAILMTAIELVRPQHLHLILLVVVLPLVLLEVGIQLARRATTRVGWRRAGRAIPVVVDMLGLDSPLVTGALRAIVLIWTTYSLGSHLGYTTFAQHVVNTPDNSLPPVTLLLDGKGGEGAAALACGVAPGAGGVVIGDTSKLRQIQATYQTCSGRGATWRLLYRDSDIVVIFASLPRERGAGARPLTLVLPATSALGLVTQ